MSTFTLPEPLNRNLYLMGDIDQAKINGILSSIIDINKSDSTLKKLYGVYDLNYVPKPINLYIDSYGGYAESSLGLVDIIKASKTPVHTIANGVAMSAALLILVSGHKRFGYTNSNYMYHSVWAVAVGNSTDLQNQAIETLNVQKRVERVFLEHTKISQKKMDKIVKTKKDWFMDSKEALELKIIDEIIT